MCGAMAPKKPPLPFQMGEVGEQWPRCPECGRELINLGICFCCPDHGAFSEELEKLELEGLAKALVESSMKARKLCIDFISKLKPKLEEEMRFLFIKGPKWNVRTYEERGGSLHLIANRSGISATRPGLWGVPMIFLLYVTWNPITVGLDDFKAIQDSIFDQYGRGENAANLVIIFAPAIVKEDAGYCAQQKTLKRLAQQGLNQVGFVVVGPDGEILSEVSGRLRGYVKHHFPEAYELLFKMRGWE